MRRFNCIGILLCICSLFFISSTCEPEDHDIALENNSDEIIYYHTSDNDFTTKNVFYDLKWGFRQVKPKDKDDNVYHLKEDGRVYVLIIKQSTMETYSKSELSEKDIYDKKYFFTFEQLKAMNFTITYTGE